MFNPVPSNPNFPEQELAIGKFWKENRIYEKSLAQRAGAEPFVFYEGPPTANGMPHPGHCLTRAIKDVFPRYRTMRGFRCERKAGWDTHGLPVEVEVCKELGIHSKEEIEAFGIEKFIQKCQQSIWRYMQEWERLTERIGFWVDLDKAYVTYHQSYVESVWWSLKNLFDRGLLYQGYKIVWWWAQGGTALSSHEVGQGYREVFDPSVYVKFPIVVNKDAEELGLDEGTALLVWTTTPWTLPSNQFAAVNPEIDYSLVRSRSNTNEKFLVARSLKTTTFLKKLYARPKQELASLREALSAQLGAALDSAPKTTPQRLAAIDEEFADWAFPEVSVIKGEKLVGLRYLPPFNGYYENSGHHFNALAGSNDARLGYREGELIAPNSRGKDLEYTGWRIVPADFVTTESGTGIVHQAPAFGEVDYDVLLREIARYKASFEPRLINAVAPDGKFTDEAPEYCRGRWVKECDKDILSDLKERGLLFHHEQYKHEYPFCWRAEQDPLIQYPRESWFIRTSDFKDEMLANSSKVNWLPEHIKSGRFGKFLESNVDWALSRERYWGTPLPIWKCEQTGKMEAVGSYDDLLKKPGISGSEVWTAAKKQNPELPDDLRVHKPYIDAVAYESPYAKGARMRRVPEVIDAWYDSGAMPFAQWGFPKKPNSDKQFESQFPADFISEAIDQTRGWFYSQLAISTLLFGNGEGGRGKAEGKDTPPSTLSLPPFPYPHPFRNCIVLGLMLGEDGQKMSKSKRNYLPPNEIFDRYGADALRWYFFANQPPWTSIRYSEQAIKDSIPEFLLRLWNVYSFFVIYANIDGFDPTEEARGASGELRASDTRASRLAPRPLSERSELDRWILSELNRTCSAVVERMDAYDNFGACQHITAFVDALSNWYVRRSRDRFWSADKRAADKLDAYWTLFEALVTITKLVAPFVPFLAETLWQNLAVSVGGNAEAPIQSVHLCDFPTGDPAAIDEALSERMNLVRLISSLGRNARNAATLKVRQPLAKVEVILADTKHQAWLEQHAAVIEEELNVKHLEFCDDPTQYVEHDVVPNFKLLGPRLGKLLPKVTQWLNQQTGAELLANIRDNGKIDLVLDGQAIALSPDEVEVRIRPKPGWTSANGQGVVVVLSTELTPDLVAEGLARDIVRLVQDLRKDIGCDYTDRIEIGLVTEATDVRAAIEKFKEYIAQETLAVRMLTEALPGVEPKIVSVAGHEVAVYMRVLK